MIREIEELRNQGQAEIRALRREINAARSNFFLRWDAKGYIQKAENKVEQIQQLLVKLESLSDQLMPVVKDIKDIVGLKYATQNQEKK